MTTTGSVLVCAYSEIALKGKNRPMFQRRLLNNIRRALAGEAVRNVNHVESRFLVRLDDGTSADSTLQIELAGTAVSHTTTVSGAAWTHVWFPVDGVLGLVSLTAFQAPPATLRSSWYRWTPAPRALGFQLTVAAPTATSAITAPSP